MESDLSVFDILLTPVYFVFVMMYAFRIKNSNIAKNPEYEYFVKGLVVRILGSMALGLVYFFYYGGGDTINYYESAIAYGNLYFKDQESFWTAWLGNPRGVYFPFDETTGYPVYTGRDLASYFVVRLLIPIVALGLHSYFASAILVALVTYGGLWRLYQTFLQEFPQLKKELAIAALFIPSCVFWGSGMMKDSFTLSGVGWFTYAFYHFFIKKNRSIKLLFYLALSSYLILSIKPYIFFALLPGSILWLTNNRIKRIKNRLLRFVAAPMLLLIGGAGAYFSLSAMGENLGQYTLDNVLDKAVITQRDMKSDHYGGKAFDIGDFDASFTGVLSVAPVAIFSGLFRPSAFDIKNFTMIISALENSYLLFLTLFLLFKLKFFNFFGLVRENPLILFCMMFSLFFAFSVGLTVANFGSLVRLRIPELPFFVGGIFMLRHLYEQKIGHKMRF